MRNSIWRSNMLRNAALTSLWDENKRSPQFVPFAGRIEIFVLLVMYTITMTGYHYPEIIICQKQNPPEVVNVYRAGATKVLSVVSETPLKVTLSGIFMCKSIEGDSWVLHLFPRGQAARFNHCRHISPTAVKTAACFYFISISPVNCTAPAVRYHISYLMRRAVRTLPLMIFAISEMAEVTKTSTASNCIPLIMFTMLRDVETGKR